MDPRFLKLGRRARQSVLNAGRELTSQARVLPDFLIIGAMKAGTTSLFEWLLSHPAVLAPGTKEPHFFTNNWLSGESWYRARFPTHFEMSAIRAIHGVAMTGEATPYCLFHPAAAERARATVSEARILVLLRDPVARAWSHYQHELRHGRERLSFSEAIEAEPQRLQGEEERLRSDPSYRSVVHQSQSYVARGRYAEQLDRWLRWFGAAQIKCIRSEDMFENPTLIWREVLEFLGLPFERLSQPDARNTRGSAQIDPEIRARLRTLFEPENAKLRGLLGRDLDW